MDSMQSRDTKPAITNRGSNLGGINSTSPNLLPPTTTKSFNIGSTATPATTRTTSGATDICQMCILLGIQVMCPNESTKYKHTDDHRRAAAAFLNLEDWALPPTGAQISKCFPSHSGIVEANIQQNAGIVATTTSNSTQVTKSTAAAISSPEIGTSTTSPPTAAGTLSTFAKLGQNLRQPQSLRPPIQQLHVRPPQQQRQSQPPPPSQQRHEGKRIQQTVAAVLFSMAPGSLPSVKTINRQQRLSAAESRDASISAAVAAVASSSATLPVQSAASFHITPSTSAVIQKRTMTQGGGGQPKRTKTNHPTAIISKNGDRGATVADEAKLIKEEFMKSVIAGIEDALRHGDSEANFQVVRNKPSCKWPRFIIDGYAYRVGRVYSTGKCELRCILKQGCNGKAVVEKNGAGYVARIVPGSVHFHSPPALSKGESGGE